MKKPVRVTGPIFGDKFQTISESIAIPEKLFKVVYIPDSKKTLVYLVENISNAVPLEISLSLLEKESGIRLNFQH